MFAYAPFSASGAPLTAISASTVPIVAASPLPLAMLWAQLAVDAARVGEVALARTAAISAVSRWVCVGPVRPLHSRNPLTSVSLRKDELARTPRPLLYGLSRALCVLADTGEGGVGLGISSSLGSGSVDAGLTCAAVDAKEEGRVWEGPWSSADKALVAAYASPVIAEMAAYRRVSTLALAVEAAVALRCVLLSSNSLRRDVCVCV